MPKDNENILPFLDGPVVRSEPQGFQPEEMVTCEACLRANPPTRVACFYCAAPLPVSEKTAALRRPTLRPLEKWEQGYNCILASTAAEQLSDGALSELADLLKLAPQVLKEIVASPPLPLARVATLDESTLVAQRLETLGLETFVVSDDQLGLEQFPPIRIRAVALDEVKLVAIPLGGGEPVQIPWDRLVLIVVGRLFSNRVEIKERKGGRGDGEILDTNEFFADEAVMEIYVAGDRSSYRILANSFDFSVLSANKSLIAEQNYVSLVDLLQRWAPHVTLDDSYDSLRSCLEAVWPSEQQTESRGWRRERAGKYTTEAIVERTNERQFSRYSRLRYYRRRESKWTTHDAA